MPRESSAGPAANEGARQGGVGNPGCPRIEPIAALLDRQLRGAERQALLDHLAECETCYGVFAATSQVLSAEIRSPSAGTRWRSLNRRMRVACLLLGLALGGFVLWRTIGQLRPQESLTALELAQSLGAAGRAVPILRPAQPGADSAGVAFGRAELHLAMAHLENRRTEALAAARTLARLAGLPANAAAPGALSIREAYGRMAAELEGGGASGAPLDGAAVIFPPRELAGGRCLEAAAHAAGGGAWFATEAARRCRAAVASLRMPGVGRVLAAWPEEGTPDALALASALSAVGKPGEGER